VHAVCVARGCPLPLAIRGELYKENTGNQRFAIHRTEIKMLYTCRVPNNTTFTPTAPFMARGLNLAPAKLGDIELFAKPNHAQLAYSAYKDNIEAFLYATATQTRVIVGVKNYPFPNHYIPTFPLPLPKVVFAIDGAKRLAPSTKTSLEAAMVKMDGELRDLQGKTGMVYLIKSPIFSAIRTTLPALAPKTIPYISGYASIHAAQAITTVYQGIEAFLATQTYEYKGEVGSVDTKDHLRFHLPKGTGYITDLDDNNDHLPRKRYAANIHMMDIMLNPIAVELELPEREKQPRRS
jgi:hypothetical protein